jgi:exodeoxyribonuclease VII large subunit
MPMSQLPFDWTPGGRPPATKPMTVSELGHRIGAALAGGLPDPLVVAGEVGTFNARNGHWFFTLRDDDGVVNCVMWASDVREAAGTLAAGEAVELTGTVVHWHRQGRTQLRVRSFLLAGEGKLQAAFRELCEELRGLGWFEQSAKRPLPRAPRAVTVLTSAAGAALTDVCATAARRWPACRLVLEDIPVQGRGAAEHIAACIARVDASAAARGIDAIILTRGGGSAEDLQAFNNRLVAAAIHEAHTPIIAAIGHEVDTSIAELVADQRASTPTAAVELLLPDREEEGQRLDLLGSSLGYRMQRRILACEQTTSQLAASLQSTMQLALERARKRVLQVDSELRAREPHAVLALRRVRVERLSAQLGDLARRHAQRASDRFGRLQLEASATRRLSAAVAVLEERRSVLEAIGPDAVLARGFSMTLGPDGRIIRTRAEVTAGDEIESKLAGGSIKSIVTESYSGGE